MADKFFEKSKTIANDFLQSIVFIDDRAYLESNNKDSNEIRMHDFDALKVTQAFAKKQKICAVYKPESKEDIDNLIGLAKKADITVLDWQIRIIEEAKEGESEQDAENDDPRGPHTIRLIKEILSDPLTGSGSLKLILVYTGDLALQDITDTIFDELQKEKISELAKDNCKISTKNVKILVIAKPSDDEDGQSKFKHNPELNERIVKYEDLPDFILNEFTLMTNGLLSNFVLQSLNILRRNTFRLIKIYNNQLDPAFAIHRLLLPNQDDSKDQMVELFSDSVSGLLNYNNAGEVLAVKEIRDWTNQKLAINYSATISGKTIKVDNNFVNNLFDSGVETWLKKYWADNNHGELSNGAVTNFVKLIEKGSSFLIPEWEDSNNVDCEFSILTHHKSNLKQPSSHPKMSLGTLIKQLPGDGCDARYFVCIQAKCDSVRLKKERKFLFLPLTKATSSKFQIVVLEDSYSKLQIVKDTYELKTIKFKPNDDGDSILAEKQDSKFVFKSTYNEDYVWICDLKDLHSQRISSNYAYQLSRIGLDESEWLRRSS